VEKALKEWAENEKEEKWISTMPEVGTYEGQERKCRQDGKVGLGCRTTWNW
jgi:hypothetical protein